MTVALALCVFVVGGIGGFIVYLLSKWEDR
jgi:hypothetical protein